MITGLIWCRLLTVSITAFTTKQCESCSKGQGALLRGDLDFILKKYNKPIPAEEAILIALISGSDVLQAEAVNISMEQLQEIKKKMIGGKV